MMRQTSAAVGVAVLATVLETGLVDGAGEPAPADQVGAYHAAFLVAAGLSVVSVALAWTVRDQDAAATMHPRSAAPEPADRPVVTTGA